MPDSLPKRDEGTDVMPDEVQSTDASQERPDSRHLLVTNKVSPRLQFASACWRSTGHWIGTVRPAGRFFELALFMDAKLDVSKGA